MAVVVNKDLTVQVLEDVNALKLNDRLQALQAAVKRGEPRCLGVSQVMLGVMIMSYSIPLYHTDVTEVVRLSVPWWSSVMFVIAGVITIIMDKHCNMMTLHVCLMASVASAVLSLAAIIIYSVDIDRNPEAPCENLYVTCGDRHYITKLSRGLKSSLLLFTLAQAAISSILCFLLLRQRRAFSPYRSFAEAAASNHADQNAMVTDGDLH